MEVQPVQHSNFYLARLLKVPYLKGAKETQLFRLRYLSVGCISLTVKADSLIEIPYCECVFLLPLYKQIAR